MNGDSLSTPRASDNLPNITITAEFPPENDQDQVNRQQNLARAYGIASSSADISRGQQKMDQAVDRPSRDQNLGATTTLSTVNGWYDENQLTIAAAASSLETLAHGDSKSADSAISTFQETTKVVIRGLDALSELHPFIAVAVVAFKLVITLDMTRRANNKKVVAIKMAMQEMMIVLFQLKDIKDPKVTMPDGRTIEDAMGALMQKIADDIHESGSACDHYMKKSFLAKTLKSTIYEARLAEHAERFISHKNELVLRLQIHATLGVDRANEKLDLQRDRLESIESKIDMLVIFQKLTSSREHQAQKFVEKHGGVKACVEDDRLLKELIDTTGVDASRMVATEQSLHKANPVDTVKKVLQKELAEDFDQALEKNLGRFKHKLELQNQRLENELKSTMHMEGDRIINVVLSGAHDLIIDKDIREVWKAMGWKGSVKARHFVLAFQDYFANAAFSGKPEVDVFEGTPLPSPVSVASNQSAAFAKDDRWTLAYINISHVQSILEAIDDDSTGFISIKEVNVFTTSKPDHWTMLHWVAFWSEGWHLTIDRYKKKIYAVCQKMHALVEEVLPLNRIHVDHYLGCVLFSFLDGILRSTAPPNDASLQDQHLVRLAEDYMISEEKRLESNLSGAGYDIDDLSTLALITGPGRIEKYLYPLLYILLCRHLAIIQLATSHVLNYEEFNQLHRSFAHILMAAERRILDISLICRQIYVNVDERFQAFGHGMFKLWYDWRENKAMNRAAFSLSKWACDDDTIKEEVDRDMDREMEGGIQKLLNNPIQDTLHSTIYTFDDDIVPGIPDVSPSVHPLVGAWAGHTLKEDLSPDAVRGLIQIWIAAVDEVGNITGKARNYCGTMTLTGKISGSGRVYFRLEHDTVLEIYPKQITVCYLTFDKERQRLNGGYRGDGDDRKTRNFWSRKYSQDNVGTADSDDTSASNSEFQDPSKMQDIIGPVEFTRTSAFLYRFRYSASEFASNPARARWLFACRAVKHQQARERWDRSYFSALLKESFRLLSLSTRRVLELNGYSPIEAVVDGEWEELQTLRVTVNPTDALFYLERILTEMLRVPVHLGINCDGCGRKPYKSRLICVVCMDDEMSDSVDFCLSCIDATPTLAKFTHDSSHPLLKVDNLLITAEHTVLIPKAREVSFRAKALFRQLANDGLELDSTLNSIGKSAEPKTAPICCCCEKTITLPCWICAKCNPDAFICVDCEEKKVPASKNGPCPGHKPLHPRVRIRNADEVSKPLSLEARQTVLESKINKLESKVEKLESMMEQRLSSLQGLLEKMVAHFPGPSSK